MTSFFHVFAFTYESISEKAATAKQQGKSKAKK